MNNLGLAQTGGTCWFHSALNLFLLNDDGFKILWAKMQDVFKNMNPTSKAWFLGNFNAPCPPRLKSLTTINSIYFWKFLDQFMCSIGGPGKLWRQHGRNRNLVSRVKWNNPALKNTPLSAGGHPRRELPKLLWHLGFKQGEYGVLVWKEFSPKDEEKELANRSYKFILYSGLRQPYDIPLEKGPFRLTGAIYSIYSRSGSGHVWACIRKGNEGYIFDSAYPEQLHRCDWWFEDKVKDFFQNSNLISKWGNNWRNRDGYFDVIMYSRGSYVDSIAPSCRRVYRPVNKSNVERMIENVPNVGQYVNNLNIPPAVKAALRKYEGTRVTINKATLNAVLRNAKTYNNANQMVSNMERAGYRIPNKNKPNSNWAKFRTALRNKFARPVPVNYYRYALYENTRNKVMKELQKLANAGGYVIPKNSNSYKNFISILNATFPNRVIRSTKRKRNNGQAR